MWRSHTPVAFHAVSFLCAIESRPLDDGELQDLASQFPAVALGVTIIGLGIWLVRSLFEIRERWSATRVNKEVLRLTLSIADSADLAKAAVDLSAALEAISQVLDEIVNAVPEAAMAEQAVHLRQFVLGIPDDWKYRPGLFVPQDRVAFFFRLDEALEQATRQITLVRAHPGTTVAATRLERLLESFARASAACRACLQRAQETAANAARQGRSTIDWIAAIRGAVAAVGIVVCGTALALLNRGRSQHDAVVARLQAEATEIGALAEQSRRTQTALESEVASIQSSLRESQAQTEEALRNYGAAAERYSELERRFEVLTGGGGGEDPRPRDFSVVIGPGSDSVLRVIVEWQADVDIDLHLRLPTGQFVDYTQPNVDGARLDHDLQRGPGSETIELRPVLDGRYVLRVANYSRKGTPTYQLRALLSGREVYSAKGATTVYDEFKFEVSNQ